jgi:4-amino-4-deoxy-L-arabinose transferase-like glycosyltransferase
MPRLPSKSSKPSDASSASPEPALSGTPVRWAYAAGLLAIAALALLLRIIGMHWGIPTGTRFYPLHPDEPDIIYAALQVDFAHQQLSPRFFNYGSLYLYLCRLTIDIVAALGGLMPVPPPSARAVEWHDFAAVHWQDFATIHLLGRSVTVAMAVATVVATGAAARRAFSPAAGILAALALALAPLHVMHAHFMTVDVPATMWVAVAFCCSLRVLGTPRRGWFAASGAAAGLAAGTKYNAGLVLLAALAAVALAARCAAPKDRREIAGAGVFYTLLAAAAAFVLATPGILIDSDTFWANLNFERAHVAQGHGYLFVGTAPAWWYHITDSLAPGLGWPLLLLCAAGVVYALQRREPADLLLLAFVVPYYALIGISQVKFARYTLPLFPPLCMWAGRGIAGWGGWAGPRRRGFAEALIRSLVVAVAAYTVCYALAIDGVMARTDNRDAAAAWLKTKATATTVALAAPPWFWTPPVTPSIGLTHGLVRFGTPPQLPRDYDLETPVDGFRLTPEELAARRPRYVVVTQFDEDDLRAARAVGQEFPMLRLQRALDRDYQPAVTFASAPRIGPLSWFTRKPPPHDMLYPMPRVTIYERRAATGT